jgi:large subunit ribosomal protein L25
MAESYELTASPRERTGKGAARATRRQGMIPGVIYGGGEPPLSISVDYKVLDLKIHAGGFLTTLATIKVDGKDIRVIPRDYQLDPVRDRPVHVDFLRVAAGSRLVVDIPVHFINDTASPGIKRGGVLNIVRHTIEVSCPAESIPNYITADLTGLDINDSLHISKIPLPEGVRPTITGRDFTVATIAAPAGIKEEQRAAADAAAGGTAAPAAGEAAAGEEKKEEAKK